MRIKNNVDKYKFRNYFFSKYNKFFSKYINSNIDKFVIEVKLIN
jgi:hypothetical protein